MAAPNRGDLVWIDFDPQAGREQAGRRPAIVLSPRSYHQLTSYVIVCPITSNVKAYPFAVPLPEGLPISGVAMADQVKNLDRRVRRIEYAGRAPASFLAEVVARLLPLLSSATDNGLS
jgi:mRNA interferase MazF